MILCGVTVLVSRLSGRSAPLLAIEGESHI
jgi:hypothetical protein